DTPYAGGSAGGRVSQPTVARPRAPRSTVAVGPVAAAAAVADDPNNPMVSRNVNDDERARERLRFLLWMRQVRAERRKRQMTPVS
ncbi:MAG: hypothetical protein ACRENS_09855, partial [Candidatus Eiseniibacteriota bacterium]